MKAKLITIVGILVLGLFFVQAKDQSETTGISFYHGKLADAKKEAIKQNKLIFIDAFTTWCGPCKVMSRKIFTQKAVGDYYNSNFINLKIDMETAEGVDLSSKYKVTGYPTFLFIDGKGKLVKKEMGLVDGSTFINFGKNARKKG